MEMPSNTVVIVLILALVLAALGAFLLQSSSTSFSQSDAQRIFASQCQNYVQQGCEWDVTYRNDFSNYLNACKSLFGQERDSYSCLYTLCKGCFQTSDLKCAGLCSICNGHEQASVDRKTCCSRFSLQCGSSGVDCSGCTGA